MNRRIFKNPVDVLATFFLGIMDIVDVVLGKFQMKMLHGGKIAVSAFVKTADRLKAVKISNVAVAL